MYLSVLAAQSEAETEAGQGQSGGDEATEAGERRGGQRARQLQDQMALGVEAEAAEFAAKGVEAGGDAGIGGAEQR